MYYLTSAALLFAHHVLKVLFVKELGLFATTFRRVDGQEVIAPNSLLASTKLVHNLRRSKSMLVRDPIHIVLI